MLAHRPYESGSIKRQAGSQCSCWSITDSTALKSPRRAVRGQGSVRLPCPGQVNGRERVVRRLKHHVVAAFTLHNGAEAKTEQLVARCHLRLRLLLEGPRTIDTKAR